MPLYQDTHTPEFAGWKEGRCVCVCVCVCVFVCVCVYVGLMSAQGGLEVYLCLCVYVFIDASIGEG